MLPFDPVSLMYIHLCSDIHKGFLSAPAVFKTSQQEGVCYIFL